MHDGMSGWRLLNHLIMGGQMICSALHEGERREEESPSNIAQSVLHPMVHFVIN